MIDITYTVSEELTDAIEKTEELRQKILLTPLPPKYSLLLYWDSMCSRIYYAHLLARIPMKREDVVHALSGKKLPKSEIGGYKEAFDYIKNEWLANDAAITDEALMQVLELYTKSKKGFNRRNLDLIRNEFKQLSDYWEHGSENPIVLAGVVYISMLRLVPLKEHNEIAASLLAYLYLYKHGYDFRGFIILEEFLTENHTEYLHAVEQSVSYGNITMWLTFFATNVAQHLEKVLHQIESRDSTLLSDDYWKLSDRQRAILAHFMRPDTKITNKKIQALFSVSQITASRDLSKLAKLGLLYAHGKGRSVYYTNIWHD